MNIQRPTFWQTAPSETREAHPPPQPAGRGPGMKATMRRATRISDQPIEGLSRVAILMRPRVGLQSEITEGRREVRFLDPAGANRRPGGILRVDVVRRIVKAQIERAKSGVIPPGDETRGVPPAVVECPDYASVGTAALDVGTPDVVVTAEMHRVSVLNGLPNAIYIVDRRLHT